jgi:hypothetical protein
MVDARQLEPALTEQERLLRDHFVSEYLKDFDPYKACLRLGFQATFAVEQCRTLYNDGYVQRKIAFVTVQALDRTSMKEKIQNRLVQIGLNGSDTASVSALRELNAMNGWSKPDGDGESEAGLIEVFRDLARQLPA